MKILKNIFTISAGLVLLTGCSDFLNSDPITTLVESNYYATEKDAQTALIGCYDGLQSIYTGDDLPSLVGPSFMSDECFAGGGTGDGVGNIMLDEFDKDRSPADVNMYEAQWKQSYKALYRCNMLLSKMDQIAWKSDDTRNKIEAETRFIRAYIYFEMVKLWGNIPLVTVPLRPEEANIPQSNPDEVYKVIESDLLFAADNAQLKGAQWTAEWAGTNDGHATVFAAKSLLARVFLFYTGYYNKTTLPNGTTNAQIVSHLTDVYNSGHGLVTPYKNLWPAACSVRDASATPIGLTTTYAGEGNKETVWAIKFNSTGAWGTNDGFFGMRLIGLRSGQVASFGTSCYGDGSWGCMPVSAGFEAGWKSEEPTDPRINSSIMNCTAEGISLIADNDVREFTGFYPKKYICLGNGSQNIYTAQELQFQINQYTDFVVIRYADVLLMLSELTKDAKYMNEVRNRVGLTPVTYTEETLRKERKHELAFEGIRYWDLLRYDYTLDYAANAVTYSGTVKYGKTRTETKTISGAKLKACKGLSQIPNNQITLSNGVLIQNEGWK